MLIKGLSFNSTTAPNDYKFNGVQYETHNNLFNYLATYRSYDPAIAKWNQLDPMNQFYNGYFAYGGNPVSLADPLGLTVDYITRNGGGDAGDRVTESNYVPFTDAFDGRRIGGFGYTPRSRLKQTRNIEAYNSLPPEVIDVIGPLLSGEQIAAGISLNAWFRETPKGGVFQGYQIIVDGNSIWTDENGNVEGGGVDFLEIF